MHWLLGVFVEASGPWTAQTQYRPIIARWLSIFAYINFVKVTVWVLNPECRGIELLLKFNLHIFKDSKSAERIAAHKGHGLEDSEEGSEFFH